MQITKRSTGLRIAAPDYETLVQQAINKVTGFDQLYKELEPVVNGCILSFKRLIKESGRSFTPEEIKNN